MLRRIGSIPAIYAAIWFGFFLLLSVLLGPVGFTDEVGLFVVALLAIIPTAVVYRSRERGKDAPR